MKGLRESGVLVTDLGEKYTPHRVKWTESGHKSSVRIGNSLSERPVLNYDVDKASKQCSGVTDTGLRMVLVQAGESDKMPPTGFISEDLTGYKQHCSMIKEVLRFHGD